MSSFNHRKYQPMPRIQKMDRRWPAQQISQAPQWCAVDLRDGNQALIEPMNVTQKQRLWHLLVKMGYKHIEVGFPSASQPDYDFVRWLIEENQIPEDVTIQVLVQARDELIERTYQALEGVHQAIVHVYNSTSPVQREKVFGLDKQGIIDIAVKGAEKVQAEAKKYPLTEWTFQYSPESFSSTETDFAIEVCNAVIDVWQPTQINKAIINLPATVECAMPNVFADQVETFCDQVNKRDSIIVSIHTHNDRGTGVAAAELALLAGADRIEGTLMGNGERTGNMDLVTIGMNLYSQGIDPQIDFSIADEIVNTVEECTAINTHPRHPWFGELVYTAFSGSHQDAIKKCLNIYEEGAPWEIAYLPIDPRDVGRTYQDVIRVNSQSGKGGVAYVLDNKYGYQLPRWLQIEFSRVVQKAAEDSGQEIAPEEIWNLFEQHYLNVASPLMLKTFSIEKSDGKETVSGTIALEGQEFKVQGQGSGMLAAFANALQSTLDIEFQVQEYGEHALSQSSAAEAVTYIQLKYQNERYTGIAVNEDIVTSSVDALLNGVGQIMQAKKQMAA